MVRPLIISEIYTIIVFVVVIKPVQNDWRKIVDSFMILMTHWLAVGVWMRWSTQFVHLIYRLKQKIICTVKPLFSVLRFSIDPDHPWTQFTVPLPFLKCLDDSIFLSISHSCISPLSACQPLNFIGNQYCAGETFRYDWDSKIMLLPSPNCTVNRGFTVYSFCSGLFCVFMILIRLNFVRS